MGVLPVVMAAAAAVANLSAPELFELADAARAAGRLDNAAAIYAALAKDPDERIRIEARYRLGVMWNNAGRPRDAATALRAATADAPDAPAIRIELAQALAALGDEDGARRELRQASATPLPADVAAEIDRFALALRSRARSGASVELALAPDSNINRATNARTLDTVLAPLVLSDAARAQSGLGVTGRAQGFMRLPLAPGLSLLPRVAGVASLYGPSEFNDVATSALIGLEWRRGGSRLTPSLGYSRRWFGGRRLADTSTLALDWLQPLSSTRQLVVSASASAARYQVNPAQDGGLFDLNVAVEQALSPQRGITLGLGATRQTAFDPGFAAWGAGGSMQVWQEVGRTTFTGSVAVRRTWGDAPPLLLPEPRREWLVSFRIGARLRGLTWQRFAPVVRVGFERNAANSELFNYRRVVFETGVVRAW